MNVKEVLKKNKVAVVSVTVLLVVGITFGGIGYAENKKVMEKARIEKAESAKKKKISDKRWADLRTVCDELFGEQLNNETIHTASIKDDLKNDTVKEMKEQYYKSKVSHNLEEFTNNVITVAENQMNQIDIAQKAVEQVFKENKVVSTDQKNYESAVKEVDNIKNEKVKKDLSTGLTKVKQEIDKKNKEEENKKKEAEKVAKESNEKAKENSVADEVVGNTQQQVQEDAQQQVYQEPVQEQGNNGWSGQSLPQAPAQQSAPSASGGGQSPTEQPATPPTSGGGQSEWIPEGGWGEQSGNIESNGGTWTGGWEEVKQ